MRRQAEKQNNDGNNYIKLLDLYSTKYPHNPEGVLKFHIDKKIREGHNRDVAIDLLLNQVSETENAHASPDIGEKSEELDDDLIARTLSRNCMQNLIAYWKKVKETIHLFDGIIVKYVIQWSAILLAIVGGSALLFGNSTPEIDFGLIAGIVALSAILISIPIAIKCWFYYKLLEEALGVAQDIEKVMFQNDVDKDLVRKIGLTWRLTKISTKRILGIRLFGWTISLPFALLIVISVVLMLYYFNHCFGWGLFWGL